MRYKVIYHIGDAIDLKTRVASGYLSIESREVVINGEPPVAVRFQDLRAVELFRMHGTGRMLKISHSGGTLFVSVIRFSLFGLFAIVNYFGTGRLKEELEAGMRDCRTTRLEGEHAT